MPDKKLTDNEIVKALECCVKATTFSDCVKCPFDTKKCLTDTRNGSAKLSFSLVEEIIDLINRQKAEIEDLQDLMVKYNGDFAKQEAEIEKLTIRLRKAEHQLDDAMKMYNIIKAEAYKECIEKVKERSKKTEIVCSGALVTIGYSISKKKLDNLLKEMERDSSAGS